MPSASLTIATGCRQDERTRTAFEELPDLASQALAADGSSTALPLARSRSELLAENAVVEPLSQFRDPFFGPNRTAAWPTIVTKSRWPRALTHSTQMPYSGLWKVTRSTGPTRNSRSDDPVGQR